MATIADAKKLYPNLADMDDDNIVEVLHGALYSDMPKEQVAASLGVKLKPPPVTPRTWGEAAGDAGRATMAGLAGLAKTGGDLYGLATGDMENPVSELGKNAQEYWTEGQSQPLKDKIAARRVAIDSEDGVIGKFGAAVKSTVTDPALMADTMFSNVATLVPGMAAGRVAQGAVGARALAAGAGEFAAGQAAAKVGTSVAVGAGALQQGADVSSSAYDDSVKKTAEQLSANPEFIARVRSGETPRDAATAMGLSAARAAFLPAVAISVAANVLPGGTMLERALLGGAARNTLKEGAAYALPKAIAKGALGEAGQETIEEGGGQYAANLAKQRYVDPNQDLSQDVGENAGLGFAGGLSMGVAGGAMHRSSGSPGGHGAQSLADTEALTAPVAVAGNEGTAQQSDAPGNMPKPAAQAMAGETTTSVDGLAPEAVPALPAGTLARATAAMVPGTLESIASANAPAPEAVPAPVDDAYESVLQNLPEAERALAMKAYAVVKRKDVDKGIKQYNQKLLDGLVEKFAADTQKAEEKAQKEPAATATPAQSATNSIALDSRNVNPATGEIRSAFEVREADRPKQHADDILHATGKPFATKLSAINKAKELGNGYQAIELGKSAYVVRQQPPEAQSSRSQPATNNVASGDEWQTFAPKSGTKGVPRADMPQIKAEHRGALVNFLAARGISHEEVEVAPSSLKPTQAEYSTAKVRQAMDFKGGDRSILISSDGHVLDGHHQWMGKGEAGEATVKAIRLNAPISQLLKTVKEFPSAESSTGIKSASVTGKLSPDEVRAFNNAYRRPIPEPLTNLQKQVRAGTAYTTANDTKQVRRAVEDAWLAANVTEAAASGTSAPQKEAAVAETGDPGAEIAQTDAKLRERRILSGIQNLIDDMPNGMVEAFTRLDAALKRIDEPVMNKQERARVKRLLDAHAGFTDKTTSSPLPKAAAVVVDSSADNSEMEARIPRRRAAPIDAAAAAAKEVSAMSDAEVLALKDHYKPTNRRHARIAKEIEKRGLNKAAEPTGQASNAIEKGAVNDESTAKTAAVSNDGAVGAESGAQLSDATRPTDGVRVDAEPVAAGVQSGPGKPGKTRKSDAETSQGAIETVAPTANTVFTEDAAAAARAILKKKLGTAIPAIDSADAVSKPPADGKPLAIAGKIDDAGAVLEGAAKLYAKAYFEKFKEGIDMDIAAVPLSKSWPEPDYQRMLDDGADPWALAFARSARDEVPNKPGTAWKVKGWASKVQLLRGFAGKVLDGTYTKAQLVAAGDGLHLSDWFNKIDLYEAVGHANSLKGLKFTSQQYSLYEGQKYSPAKTLWTVNQPSTKASSTWSNGNWGKDIVVADTKAEAIEKFKTWTAEQGEQTPAAAKTTTFDIYSYRSKPGVVIVGKRLSAGNSIDLKEFATVKEAREYKSSNQAELEKLLEAEKYVPPERKETNAPRVGADHRNGADVTNEQFREAFGFRGEQFGQSMPQNERQSNLNQTYDALMDLAGVIGVPPKALSLNGELGMAFGARGKGGKRPAAAHYEADTTGAVTPNRVVINLTRKNGAGSLAHEWFHAVDNYFARKQGQTSGFMTERIVRDEGVRKEMKDAFTSLMRAVNSTALAQRSKELDKTRSKAYWSTGLEMAARSFESYVIAKLQDQNGSNDYLANIVNEAEFAKENAYPYLTAGELPAIRAAFDHFFSTIQTREDDAGNVAMFSRTSGQVAPVSQAADEGRRQQSAEPAPRDLKLGPNEAADKASSEKVDAEDPSFSRPTDFSAAAQAQATEAVESQAIAIARRWSNAPEIVVAFDMQDARIPQRIRDEDLKQRSGGAAGTPEGFYFKGKVYLMSSQLATKQEVARVLAHEALGHFGLRGLYGKELTPILQQIAALRGIEVNAKMKEYGLRGVNNLERLVAAEEVLAEMAQTRPEIGYVKRAIAVIRTWLRRNVPGMKNIALTDDEIIQNYILPARGWVERAQAADKPAPAGQPAFERKADQLDSRVEDIGSFDPLNPDIRFSRAGTAALVSGVTDRLNETFNHPGTISLWDRTVGSQYHLAERNAPFKRVFTASQDFINDVSYYAAESADMAAKMLPKLDGWKDLAKVPVSAQDNKAIEAPINQGTLSWTRDESGKPVRVEEVTAAHDKLSFEEKGQMLLRKRLVTADELKRWKGSTLSVYEGAVGKRFDAEFAAPGVVWTDSELSTMFGLKPEQIGLYREFRAATDKSLDNLAKADLLRYGGKDTEGLADTVMEASDADAAAVMLRDYLMSLAGADKGRADELNALAGGMIDRADKVGKLKERGYAPLSRFGRYSVDVVVNGERQYFGLFETMREANQTAASMRMEFGPANVAQGTMSQREFEQFQGITPESIELFGNMLGLDSTGDEAQDQAFQAYLRLTKNNRSAMKRMIHRKGIAGYHTDVGRVLAAFVYSNARQTAAALHMRKIADAIQEIPKGDGAVKDAAIELSNYIKQPREEAHAIRGLMFAQYLGGSIASAFVNFTQPLTVSFPYLSQYGGAAKSGAALVQAMKDQREGVKLEPGLAHALRLAEEKGTVSPQSVHELMAQAQGRAAMQSGDGTRTGDSIALAKNNFAKVMFGWGKLFGWAEQINRRSTYIAAYRIAVDQKIANPGDFATKVVDETQFISNKGNKAKFARGAVGGTLMTFKSYSVNYLELLHRMSTQSGPEGKKAAALMLGMLMLMAGAGGLPFAEDLDDVVDFFAQRLGYNFSAKKAKQQFLEDLFGKAMADFVDKGVSGLPGSPLDTSGRMSMGNLIPGTGMLLKKRDHTSDVQELFGPAGDLVKRTFKAGDALLGGNVVEAVKTIAPKAIYNALKGLDMAETGSYNDDRGFKVLETSPAEAALKAIGFQPAGVANVQEANYLNQRARDFYSLNAQAINATWAQGLFRKDPDKVAEARQMMSDWNEQNPDQRMKANMPAILKKAREMAKSKDQRIADTAPKAMRNQLRAEIAERREAQQ